MKLSPTTASPLTLTATTVYDTSRSAGDRQTVEVSAFSGFRRGTCQTSAPSPRYCKGVASQHQTDTTASKLHVIRPAKHRRRWSCCVA
eukprot:38673-Eustigmatos_ZCMA.PRE.1